MPSPQKLEKRYHQKSDVCNSSIESHKSGSQYVVRDPSRPEVIIFFMGFGRVETQE